MNILHQDKRKRHRMINIYTDGASSNNQNQDIAKAGVGVYFGNNDPRNISERLKGTPQTNNRAELTAMIRALEVAKKYSMKEICIISDSSYCIKGVTEWMVGWKSRNFRSVKNIDLWSAFNLLKDERDALGLITIFLKVKGHSGVDGNDKADFLATEGAKKEL